MVQQLKSQPVMLASHTGANSYPGHPASDLAPTNVPGKTGEDDPSTRAPDTHVEDLEEAPVFWLKPGRAQVVGIWEVNQQIEDSHSFSFSIFFLPLTLSFSVSLFISPSF